MLPGFRLWEPPSVVMLSASLSVAAADMLSSDLPDPARRISARALCDSSCVRLPVTFGRPCWPADTCHMCMQPLNGTDLPGKLPTNLKHVWHHC